MSWFMEIYMDFYQKQIKSIEIPRTELGLWHKKPSRNLQLSTAGRLRPLFRYVLEPKKKSIRMFFSNAPTKTKLE